MKKVLSSLVVLAALSMPMANAQSTVVGTLKADGSAVVKRVKGSVGKALSGLKNVGKNLLNTVKQATQDTEDTVQFVITGA